MLGWGDTVTASPRAELEALGVAPRAAAWIADYIAKNGCLFDQWGVDAGATRMAQTLHEGAWFKVGDLPTAITSKTGGRQGCKLGSVIFQSAYSIALKLLEAEMGRMGVVFKAQVPNGAFWQPRSRDRITTPPCSTRRLSTMRA